MLCGYRAWPSGCLACCTSVCGYWTQRSRHIGCYTRTICAYWAVTPGHLAVSLPLDLTQPCGCKRVRLDTASELDLLTFDAVVYEEGRDVLLLRGEDLGQPEPARCGAGRRERRSTERERGREREGGRGR
eukprot:2450766-Rhodomonas_salina.1